MNALVYVDLLFLKSDLKYLLYVENSILHTT